MLVGRKKSVSLLGVPCSGGKPVWLGEWLMVQQRCWSIATIRVLLRKVETINCFLIRQRCYTTELSSAKVPSKDRSQGDTIFRLVPSKAIMCVSPPKSTKKNADLGDSNPSTRVSLAKKGHSTAISSNKHQRFWLPLFRRHRLGSPS